MKLIKPSEVAQILDIRESTLEGWRHRGNGPDLPWVKIGRAIRYRDCDVDRVISDNIQQVGAA